MNSKHLYCWQRMCLCQWFAPIRNEYQTLGSRLYLNILDLPVWMKHLAPTEAAIFCIDCPILHQVQHDFRTRLSESTFLVQNNGLFTFYTASNFILCLKTLLSTHVHNCECCCSEVVHDSLRFMWLSYHIFGWWRTVVQKFSQTNNKCFLVHGMNSPWPHFQSTDLHQPPISLKIFPSQKTKS